MEISNKINKRGQEPFYDIIKIMRKQQNNFAYIDGSNLHKGISDLGWGLDYKKFRVWLKEKYNIEKAFI